MASPTQEATASGAVQDGGKPLVLLADPLILEFQPVLSARYCLVPAAGTDVATSASARMLLTIDLPAVTAELIDALPALELFVATSVGVDHIDLAACRHRGIRVTNAGNAYAADAADYAVGLVVATLRHVPAHGEYPLATKVGLVVAATHLRRVPDAADYAVGLVVTTLRHVPAHGWAAHGEYPLATKVLDFLPAIFAAAASPTNSRSDRTGGKE